ncbi:type II toxin-antitoxin system VapC family toxin [Flavobacteriaceae bacterium 14752]|uniref:type II toxin-antitoxin system VapC family toxin n=1 Tax=Mesohalobacter salilacus TaxID=2491711 RepID=UPI000F630167|nr:PIN domain-containing protein [Flavobacteriaceae bacterium 14752]
MNKVFIDSDIIIDYFYDRHPFSESASKVLNLCAYNKVVAFTSPLVVANVYYLLRKTAKHDKVIANLKGLLKYMRIINMNQKIVLKALNSDFIDFEDALQNFAAIESKHINIIITRNVKDYKKSSLTIYTPESYLKIIN